MKYCSDSEKIDLQAGPLDREEQGTMAPKLFETIEFLESLIFHWKIFGLLLLGKMGISKFIRKSLHLHPLLSRCHETSVYNRYYNSNHSTKFLSLDEA